MSDLSYKTYGKVFRAWISVIPAVFVLDPKDIQIILGSSRHTDKSFVYSLMHNFIGRGLISNSGKCLVLLFKNSSSKLVLTLGYKWRLHRRLIQPYFNINILDLYTTTFWQSSSRQIKQLETSREVNINNFVNSCVLDILHGEYIAISFVVFINLLY